jgi:hypothetical protein
VGLVRAEVHRAGQLFAFAGATGAVLAAIRQADALTDAGGQQIFLWLGVETAAAGLYGDGVSHGLVILLGCRSMRAMLEKVDFAC